MITRIKEKYKLMIAIIISIIAFAIVSLFLYSYGKQETTEEISEILQDNTIVTEEENKTLIAYLSKVEEKNEWVEIKNINETNRETYVNQEGIEYYIDCTLTIDKLGLQYPVLSETSTELLNHNLNKFWGCNPNEVGNYVIVGHNYNNGSYFGTLDELELNDVIKITDVNGKTLSYRIYDMYYVDPTDVRCTSQLTDGKKEVTLITCNYNGSERLVVKATEIK